MPRACLNQECSMPGNDDLLKQAPPEIVPAILALASVPSQDIAECE